MKFSRVFSLASLILFLASFYAYGQDAANSPPKSSANVNVKYDKGADRTTVSLKKMTITRPDQEKGLASNIPLHQMDLEASFRYRGQIPQPPVENVVLVFKCVANTYIFLRAQEVIAAIDRNVPDKGRGFSLGTTGYKSQPPKFNTVHEEFLEIAVPVDALRKFATAQTLELFVGPVSYTLTPKQLTALKEWISLLPDGRA